MTISILLAWSWGGHGDITRSAVAIGISALFMSNKRDVLRRLVNVSHILEMLRRNSGRPDSTSKKDVEAKLAEMEKHPPFPGEQALARLFDTLPRRVQTEDLHAGNLPGVGEYLDGDGQTRHFMRTHKTTGQREALTNSFRYIYLNLWRAWAAMRKAAYHEKHWYDFIYDSTWGDFDDGLDYLARALHVIEDSYAPGHVRRDRGTYIIQEIYYWPDVDAPRPNDTPPWPGHKKYDNPSYVDSIEYADEARRTAGDFVSVILLNLDQDVPAATKAIVDCLYRHYANNLR